MILLDVLSFKTLRLPDELHELALKKGGLDGSSRHLYPARLERGAEHQ
jgi:hypothetical protein